MSINQQLPDYQELFGTLDFKTGDPGRSVYSPAAYLSDLLQLMEDKFVEPDFFFRRPDIREILLNGDHTFTTIPYLDVVNTVLEARMRKANNEADPYVTLAEARHPFALPFQLPHEQLKKYLGFLELAPTTLLEMFATTGNNELQARLSLGLSNEATAILVTDASGDPGQLRTFFNLSAEEGFEELQDAARFMKATGLSGPEIRELLYANLSAIPNAAGETEQDRAAELFIHHQIGGVVWLDEANEMLTWSGDGEVIPMAWFDRVNRLIRLCRQTGISLSDADLILRTCCQQQLNESAISRIAMLKRLQQQTELPMDVLASLFAGMNSLGTGDEEQPQDVFNRTYNRHWAALEQVRLEADGAFVHKAYDGMAILRQRGELFLPDNQPLRARIQQALHLSAKQLEAIVQTFQQRAEAAGRISVFDRNLDHESLSLLHRVAVLADLMDLAVTDLLHMLDVLSHDPNVRLFNHFRVQLFEEGQEQDAFAILENGDLSSRFWLVQTIMALGAWMADNDLEAADLLWITTGATETEEDTQTVLAFLNTWWASVVEVLANTASLEAAGLPPRSARLLMDVLSEEEGLFVPGQNGGLLKWNEPAAEAASMEVISRMGRLTVADLAELQPGERLAEKILQHLIRHGYMDLEGRLLAGAWPTDPADFSLETDFSTIREQVSNQLQDMAREAVKEAPEGDPAELSVFLSDFADLGLPLDALEELYDNLIYLGLISEDGVVNDPETMALEGIPALQSPLANAADLVHEFLAEKMGEFLLHPLSISESALEGISLKPVERADLMENLVFNDYLTETLEIADKEQILHLNDRDFALALPFYPHRKAILGALQAATSAFRDQYLKLNAESFQPLAHLVVAEEAWIRVEADHMESETWTDAGQAFFQNPLNVAEFSLGAGFTAEENQRIFSGISALLADGEKLKLRPSALEPAGLDTADVEEIQNILIAEGWLNKEGMPEFDRLSELLNINTGLNFPVLGYEDFQKDIFFAVHEVAGRVKAQLDELTGVLKSISAEQENRSYAALAEFLELTPESAALLVQKFRSGADWPLEALLVPLVDSVNPLGAITDISREDGFDRSIRRMRQFARLASSLGLRTREIDILFDDQNLADKFPERLHLPDGVTRIDAMLPGSYGELLVFSGASFLTYDPATCELLEGLRPLADLSPLFDGLDGVDAAFEEPSGDQWLISGTNYFLKEAGEEAWEPAARQWGLSADGMSGSGKIDAAFTDGNGVTYLFSGDSYMRYTYGVGQADEGYPRKIREHWPTELEGLTMPEDWMEGLEAAVEDLDGTVYFFKGTQFIRSANPDEPQDIADHWGLVDSQFDDLTGLDAVVDLGGMIHLVRGNQVLGYLDGMEQGMVFAEEGFPQKLESLFPGLSHHFQDGIEAGFTGWDEATYLFRGQQVARSTDGTGESWEVANVKEQWGKVQNHLRDSGRVDAALFGLDGKVYLFSGDQYVRYSGTNYKFVDEGYPRHIAADWGGLDRVDAAFVLDGKTYLFQHHGEAGGHYVRFSTNEYHEVDAGYPKAVDDNWWNLPASLIDRGFQTPDAVFVGLDQRTYLFSGDTFIYFDHNHRWWSEPQSLHQDWDSMGLWQVSAAFTGKDGRSYFFGEGGDEGMAGQLVVRYSDPTYQKKDDRYPQAVKGQWGMVLNNVERTGKIQAALKLRSTVEEENEAGNLQPQTYEFTYLFSGNQYIRYTGSSYEFVDQGYPKLIRTGLTAEPAFQNLKANLDNGIDAAWADQRQVYLVKGDQLHVVSSESYRATELPGPMAGAHALMVEEGSLYVQGADGWQRLNNPEAASHFSENVVPRSLRDLPEDWTEGLSAVLETHAGQTFLFKEDECFDLSLDRSYPTALAWGRVENPVAEIGQVDAALLGSDGRFYVFSGSSFLAYEVDEDAPEFFPGVADGLPGSVSEAFGGLDHVRIAFIRDGVTYLCEAPDSDGNFRYQTFSGTDYTKPDQAKPRYGDFAWWGMPSLYMEDGFERVDAVLADDDNLLLFHDNEFVQLDLVANVWTYPRPVTQLWRNFPFEHPEFDEIHTLAAGPFGETYFFSEEFFIRLDEEGFDAALPTSEVWGQLDNRLAQTGAVDAALVLETATYLFAGDQYVRYSGDSFEYVDAGYPKPLVGNLRTEDRFQQLPESFEEILRAIETGEIRLIGAFANAGTIFLATDQELHAVSASLSRQYSLAHLGQIRNEIHLSGRIDAATTDQQGALFLFCEDQYVRYSSGSFDVVDDGYPRSIRNGLAEDLGFETIPEFFHTGIDAVVSLHGVQSHILIREDAYIRSDDPSGEPMPVSEFWQGAANVFASDGEENVSIDAAFVAPGGELFVFKSGQYIRYSDPSSDWMDEGFSRFVRDDWGNLAVEFEWEIDGAFVFDGRSYLCRGEHYVRYSDPLFRRMDDGFPQAFTLRWRDSNDFLLSDLQVITGIRSLREFPTDSDLDLVDFLHDGMGYNKDPFEFLATYFGWDQEDLRWVKRHNAFLPGQPSSAQETEFSLELVVRMADILQSCQRIGVVPKDLYENVWRPLFLQNNVAGAADTVYRILGVKHQGPDWDVLQRQIRDEMNMLRRDALVAWAVVNTPGVENVRDLFELLLLDVEMDSCAETSSVKEAAAAIQLYFHRYLVNLELIDLKGNKDQQVREELRDQWRWMKNYRVWEANRKVFLYPENYIRPELRDTKTPAFKTLEDELLQGDINEALVNKVFNNYLGEYATVSSLTITGGYVYDDPDSVYGKELVLFGRTKKDPKQYYFRTAAFTNSSTNSALWEPWTKLEVEINANRVYPVYAFGRVFVFWTTVDVVTREDSKTTLQTKDSGNSTEVSNTQSVDYYLRIYYSYYDLNGQWLQPQLLNTHISKNGPITNQRLFVENSEKLNGYDYENILINANYDFIHWKQGAHGFPLPELRSEASSFTLTSELTLQETDRPAMRTEELDVFQSLFGVEEWGTLLRDGNIVQLNSLEKSTDGPWFSFDHKSGSFLVKPKNDGLTAANDLQPIADNDLFPEWDHIDAAFEGPDQVWYFFHNDLGVFRQVALVEDPESRRASRKSLGDQPISSRWGKQASKLVLDNRLDAAWNNKGQLYLFRGDEYVLYSGSDRYADRNNPRRISDGGNGLPRWSSMDAVLDDGKGGAWFFRGQEYVHSSNLTRKGLITDLFGSDANTFTDPSRIQLPVDAAFTFGTHTFLINDQEYIRYTGSDYVTHDPGYPKPSSFHAILEELGCTNNDNAFKSRKVDGAYNLGQAVFFILDNSKHYRFSDGKVSELAEQPFYSAAVVVNGNVYTINQKTFNFKDIFGQNVTISRTSGINASLLGLDGKLYMFSGQEVYVLDANVFHTLTNTAPLSPIIDSLFLNPVDFRTIWGRSPSNFLAGKTVSAAFRKGQQTFLFAGAEYVRYTGAGFQEPDPGYPKSIKNNPDQLPKWDGMDAVLPDVDGITHFFFEHEYTTSADLSKVGIINHRWGHIRNNILERGVDSAYADGKSLYLFSGGEINRYTVRADGSLPEVMDASYPKAIDLPATDFSNVSAAFTYKDDLYLVGDNSFVVCPKDQPYRLRSGYPKPGKLGAVVRDVMARNGLSSQAYGYFDILSIEGAYIQGNQLVIQTDWRIFWLNSSKIEIRISLTTGHFEGYRWGQFFTAAANTASGLVTTNNPVFQAAVDLGDRALVFREGRFMELESFPASFDNIDWNPDERSVEGIWGSPSIDAAFIQDNRAYLFSYDQYFRFDAGKEPVDFSQAMAINGNWANLLPGFATGIDAAMDTEEYLFLFKGDRYSVYYKEFASSAVPYEISSAKYDIIRLTTGTARALESRLLGGGVKRLLSLDTQEIDEIPGFSFTESRPNLIRVNSDKIDLTGIPESNHLDFNSANGLYYWEVFFHAPFLIAQTLNTAQRFEEAKTWYEYMFDPTESDLYWKFLPFLSVDIRAIVDSLEAVVGTLGTMPIQPETTWNTVKNRLAEIQANLLPMTEGFQGLRPLTGAEIQTMRGYGDLSDLETSVLGLFTNASDRDVRKRFEEERKNLQDQLFLVMGLSRNFEAMMTTEGQMARYLEDPFDPHAIASLRRIAYRKSIVMSYIDNLLDWGDMLFTRYTMESIDEARMLYILAYDLLGRKPEGLGKLVLSEDRSYSDLYDKDDDYDFLLYLENTLDLDTDLTFSGQVHDSILNLTYFYVPENDLFREYWNRVEDRLYKIRHCLNIFGVKQPLPLFQPPIDPMALVRAAAGGGGFGAALAGMDVPVPHYRFTFMYEKAVGLVQKLNQFSGDLLMTLEKKDAEALSMLQADQEKEIYQLTLEVRKAQLSEAKTNLASLNESLKNAAKRSSTYQSWKDKSFNGWEIAQMTVMTGAVVAHAVSAVSRVVAAIGSAAPDALVGPFIMGVKHGGGKVHDIFNTVAEVSQTIAEALSIGGEILGIVGQHMRMQDEWSLQKDLADIDQAQIRQQIEGAKYQIKAAEYEVQLVEKQLEHNTSMSKFLREKFTNRDLYNWMSGKLSGLYYQTYKMSLDMARYAEKAYQYERGIKQSEASFIKGFYWDSQRKGLLAGEALGLDLDRMEKAFVETDKRRFEITKEFSLLSHDPIAFLQLKASGVCEFHLTEAMFDYDFPGHYCRQIKTIAVSFDAGDGVFLNATLTQLNNRVVIEPDPKAVKFLLKPDGQPPLSIRTGWNGHQQIALSHHDEFEKNNGLFELRFDSEKYLPFEGTGAVSSWRLEINGKKGSFDPQNLVDVVVNLKYTALQGGDAFATRVKGLLKPYDAVRYFDMTYDFHQTWLEFLQNDEKSLTLTFTRDMFPNMGSSKIAGIYARFETAGEGGLSATLNGEYELKDGKITDASGLSIRSQGSELTFAFKGDKGILRNLLLGMSYKATV